MKTIIVPTDFSDISLNAVNYAADMACVINTNLAIIHVCAIPLDFNHPGAPVYNVSELIVDAEKQMTSLKEKILIRTGERVKTYTKVLMGDVVTVIDDFSAATNTYAVIMGAESTGAFERVLFGGKTISSLRRL